MQRSNGAPVLVPAFGLSLYGLVLLSSLGSVLVVPTVCAQRTPGTINVGAEVGAPAGVSAKLYHTGHTVYTGLLTTDGDEVAKLYLYRHRERPLPDSLVHLYVGPGLLIGTTTLNSPEPNLNLGLSLQAGLNFYAERFEIFLHVTPILHFLPKLAPELGASVGLRYSFGRP